jgi:SAM-dependent methyltransferase
MKTRESGMPPVELWREFFDPYEVLRRLGLAPECPQVVDFGCGYGTFAAPAAQTISGHVLALDIDPAMVRATQALAAGLPNISVVERDFVETGCGLPDATAHFVMLFNILHAEEAFALLQEAKRVLVPTGRLAVMHWIHDSTTPRGPSMTIRLQPEQCVRLVESAGFRVGELIDLPPYHYGFSALPV